MPKILLLFCGGTISMSKNKSGALESHYTAEQFFEMEPRFKNIANIDVTIVDNIDSTNINHKQWEKIVDIIAKNYKKYDGFLITHGTNTLGYTSSALSFALPNIGKPVVLTGSQIPGEIINSDARNNLANALKVATLKIGGIFVVFGSKIIVGCRAKKISESELDAFKTFNDKDFGEVRIKIKINNQTRPAHNNILIVKNGFEDDVVCLTLFPGLKSKYIINLIDSGTKGIILRAFGSGDIQYDLLPALNYAREQKVPILVTTQCPGGATMMGVNDPGLQAIKAGVIQVFDMSMEAMSTKLMWALKQGVPYKKMKTVIQTSVVGEINTDTNAKYY
ncbi:MAG: hypothetical protein ACD_72C00415G0005 [uncultured bacterium]|nr:MAG: hypothetical protein ACD_72C00415G0005 [uncultured bacterium]